MLKRILAVLTTVVLTLGLAVGATLPASAHTPTVTASCSTLTVQLDSYGGGTTNTVTVTVDGSVVENSTFGNSFAQKTYSFSGATSHSYVVEIDAQHNDHDRTVAMGNAFTGTTIPCTTAVCTNPLTSLDNFTIVTEGDLTVSNGGAHAEGTAAVGGDLVVNSQYHVQNNHDGTALPVVDGESTGLLVGGKVTLNASGEAFQVNAGATRVGDTTGAAVTDGKRYRPVSAQDRYVRMSVDATVSDVAALGLFASTFPSLFSSLRTASNAIADYDNDDVNFVTTSANGGDGQKVTLSAGVTNVLRVTASELSAITKLWFDGGVVPSSTTPFIIDVTGAGTVTATAPVLMNIDAGYVLWNFSATTLNLSTSEFIKGSVLAPRAQLNLTSGGIEGQIAAKSMVVSSSSEIHHIAYSSCAGSTEVSGAAVSAAEYCDTGLYLVHQGTVTATAATGVTYELWNSAKTTKIADLTAGTPYDVDSGSYAVKVLAASSSYTVSTANTWIAVSVGAYTGDCSAPQDVAGAATAAAEYCDSSDYEVAPGSVTATVTAGVRYELWNSTKSTKLADLTAGTPYDVSGGTYFVKALPASGAYTVSTTNTWIAVLVGDYTGVCAQGVSGSATSSAEYCDSTVYEVKQGSVTAHAATGVSYELWNAAKSTKIADLTAETAYLVDAGTYYVKVLPATPTYTVSDADTWIQVAVDENTTVCSVIGDPSTFEQCVVDSVDPLTSNWTANLTIVAVDHVQYRVYFSDGVTWIDQGVWAAGAYDAGTAQLPYGTVVKVVAEASTGWNLLAPKDWTFEFQDEFDCNLPTGGIVEPEVVFSETCSAGATYTLSIEGGDEGMVLWSVNGGHQTTQLGTFTVASPTTVSIVATPAPGSGLSGSLPTIEFTHTFTGSSDCDLETLALTGATALPSLAAAVLLLQAGLALLAVGFVRARRTARHLAA